MENSVRRMGMMCHCGNLMEYDEGWCEYRCQYCGMRLTKEEVDAQGAERQKKEDAKAFKENITAAEASKLIDEKKGRQLPAKTNEVKTGSQKSGEDVLAVLAVLAILAGLAGLAGFAGFADLAGLAGLAGFAGLAGLAGLAGRAVWDVVVRNGLKRRGR